MKYPLNPYIPFLEPFAPICKDGQSAISKWLSLPEDVRRRYIRDLRYQMSHAEVARLIGNVLQELADLGEPLR